MKGGATLQTIESLLVEIMELKLVVSKTTSVGYYGKFFRNYTRPNKDNENLEKIESKVNQVKELINNIPIYKCFSIDDDIIFAYKFSIFLYRNTFRKIKDVSMVAHTYRVAEILNECNASKETIIAGLLHDVIEDTPYKDVILSVFFNEEIMDTVLFHTEDKSKSWEVRKLTTITEVSDDEHSEGVWLILADRIANMEDLILNYPVDWSIFNRGVDKQYWYFSEIYNHALNQKEIFPELGYYKDCMDMLFEEYLSESKS